MEFTGYIFWKGGEYSLEDLWRLTHRQEAFVYNEALQEWWFFDGVETLRKSTVSPPDVSFGSFVAKAGDIMEGDLSLKTFKLLFGNATETANIFGTKSADGSKTVLNVRADSLDLLSMLSVFSQKDNKDNKDTLTFRPIGSADYITFESALSVGGPAGGGPFLSADRIEIRALNLGYGLIEATGGNGYYIPLHLDADRLNINVREGVLILNAGENALTVSGTTTLNKLVVNDIVDISAIETSGTFSVVASSTIILNSGDGVIIASSSGYSLSVYGNSLFDSVLKVGVEIDTPVITSSSGTLRITANSVILDTVTGFIVPESDSGYSLTVHGISKFLGVVTGVAPINDLDLATKKYVDDSQTDTSAFIKLDGTSAAMTGSLKVAPHQGVMFDIGVDYGGHTQVSAIYGQVDILAGPGDGIINREITVNTDKFNIPEPVGAGTAATKGYVDSKIGTPGEDLFMETYKLDFGSSGYSYLEWEDGSYPGIGINGRAIFRAEVRFNGPIGTDIDVSKVNPTMTLGVLAIMETSQYRFLDNSDLLAGRFIYHQSSGDIKLERATAGSVVSSLTLQSNGSILVGGLDTGFGQIKFRELTQAQYTAIGAGNYDNDTQYTIIG